MVVQASRPLEFVRFVPHDTGPPLRDIVLLMSHADRGVQEDPAQAPQCCGEMHFVSSRSGRPLNEGLHHLPQGGNDVGLLASERFGDMLCVSRSALPAPRGRLHDVPSSREDMALLPPVLDALYGVPQRSVRSLDGGLHHLPQGGN